MLMARDTRTGQVLEQMILPAFEMGGYEVKKQVNIGTRLGGGKHYVDNLISKNNRQILVSLKWQQSAGTAEQKVPYEFMCLVKALRGNKEFNAAYIVIGGTGWTKDSFFLEELDDWVISSESVRVIRLEEFVAMANSGRI